MLRIASRCGNRSPGPSGPRLRRLALAALLVALFAVVPASGAPATAAGSVTVTVHGQGRVTSEPAGEIDCPGRCVVAYAGARTLTLRAAPAAGWAVAENAFCGAVDTCTVSLGDDVYSLDVFFRPAAKLQLWPNGDGAVSVSPAPADERGLPRSDPCTPATASDTAGCEFFYVPGTAVTATAAAATGSSFLGWSARQCPGRGGCAIRLDRDRTSLVARFSPLQLRIRRGGLDPEAGAATIVSEPAGISCPPTCEAPFPYGARVTLVAVPDPTAPFVGWKFGCSVSSADPRRCTATLTNRPTWVGVALGQDDQIGVPATLAVLFGVARDGRGAVAGRKLACGTKCESEYTFGEREELRATPAAGWRFGGWSGACARKRACALHVGPVTSVGARFIENLVPQLLSVKASGQRAGRRVALRISVRHAAQARVQLRRVGAARLLAQRRYALRGGSTTLVLPVPAGTNAGRLRLTIAVSDDTGGGRTWTRVVRVGS